VAVAEGGDIEANRARTSSGRKRKPERRKGDRLGRLIAINNGKQGCFESAEVDRFGGLCFLVELEMVGEVPGVEGEPLRSPVADHECFHRFD